MKNTYSVSQQKLERPSTVALYLGLHFLSQILPGIVDNLGTLRKGAAYGYGSRQCHPLLTSKQMEIMDVHPAKLIENYGTV
jgi:hypothetical protein